MTDDSRTDGHVGRHGAAVVNGPDGGDLDWYSVDWGQVEDDVGRLRHRDPLGLLEPGAVKVARRVLRGPRRSNAPGLPDLELVLGGADLLAWLRLGCLDGELARAEPKSLRYRLLHAAARLVRQARRIILRLPEHWPWAAELAGAYRRLALLGS